MITGEQKPFEEIVEMVKGFKRVLVVGCNTCVAICFSGGEKEAQILASSLSMESKTSGRDQKITDKTVQRQCEWEFVEELTEEVQKADAVVSLACGAGIQALAEKFPDKVIIPGLNTTFLGITEKEGVWIEKCTACGECVLFYTGGICPITRCAKSLMNGPCGGSQDGKCEISADTPCAWQLIYERLKTINRLDLFEMIKPAKDWSKSHSGGPRKIVREDLIIEEKQEQ